MKDVDIAYVAGLVDGEGCLTLQRRAMVGGINVYQLNICIANNNREILEWVQSMFGGAVTTSNHCLYLRFYRVKEQLQFLRTLLPHLRIKKRQAELLLAYRDTVGRVGPAVTSQIATLRASIFNELTALNGARTGKRSKFSPAL